MCQRIFVCRLNLRIYKEWPVCMEDYDDQRNYAVSLLPQRVRFTHKILCTCSGKRCVHFVYIVVSLFSTKLSFHGAYVASKLTAFCKYDIKSKYFAGPYFVIIADQINKAVNCLYVLLNFSWHVYQLLLNINFMPSFYLLFIFNNFGTKSYITF